MTASSESGKFGSIPAVSLQTGHVPHTNPVIEAGRIRSLDETNFQNLRRSTQLQENIYNEEIEPEHDNDGYPCKCPSHAYQRAKYNRRPVHRQWSKAVKYPGEKTYNDSYISTRPNTFVHNPYSRIPSPYGVINNATSNSPFVPPKPGFHAAFIRETLILNARLNAAAQAHVQSLEPTTNIWDFSNTSLDTAPQEKTSGEKGNPQQSASVPGIPDAGAKSSGFRKFLGLKTAEEKQAAKVAKVEAHNNELRNSILAEETGRWPSDDYRDIVDVYQLKTGMKKKIVQLRSGHPVEYLHLLCAGYFEPIPIAWATTNGNPLKFSIEAAGGWRGITPQWRGYEDTAEERLYWVLNHRDDPEGKPQQRLKPDFISALRMARERMARAVSPPPQYFSPFDVCYLEHKSESYSKQVLPPPFIPHDRPQVPTDDTMILLDVSGSMDFDPIRPTYDQYLITGWSHSSQPKNRSLAEAIIRRFTDAMIQHDGTHEGYDLVTFSDTGYYAGKISHNNFKERWGSLRFSGGTRVMTGWQRVKDLHFRKHEASATHHAVYGWIAGPETPMLRLLLLLDGEATDMDEFELDLLGLDWAHITIFLVGVDGCPHHHRHANELQRISEVNHHVSFVDAQGNTPERFVTHELLKRHLGQEITMSEFEAMENLPAYTR